MHLYVATFDDSGDRYIKYTCRFTYLLLSIYAHLGQGFGRL